MNVDEEKLALKVKEMKDMVLGIEGLANKSDEGVLSAGTKLRRELQNLRKAAQTIRQACLARDHARKPPKAPKPKADAPAAT